MTPRLGDRTLFPALRPHAYLNHAAISPPSRLVTHAVTRAMSEQAQRGVDVFLDHIEQRGRLKDKLARFIGGRKEDIAFVANTTTGVIDIALSLPWRAGDRVLVVDREFPANVTPWQRAAQMFDLVIEALPAPDPAEPEQGWLAKFEQYVVGARLVAVSAVQFQTGLRMPLQEMGRLCKLHGCELFVDAIQGLGLVDIDVARDGIHYLCAGSHKWLMGPEGVAVLYVQEACARRLKPHLAGWLSHDDALSFLFEGKGNLRYDRDFKRSAELFEQGMPNTLGCVGLEASLDAIISLGTAAIREHVSAYLDALENGLVERGYRSMRARERHRQSGILSVAPPDDRSAIDLQLQLQAAGISCSTPDGLLRFAPHWPNHLREVAAVCAAI